MKLFRTNSANIVEDCQNFYYFLPVSYVIDIRTAKLLEMKIVCVNYLLTMLNVV